MSDENPTVKKPRFGGKRASVLVSLVAVVAAGVVMVVNRQPDAASPTSHDPAPSHIDTSAGEPLPPTPEATAASCIDILRKAAELGDAKAMYILAEMLPGGQGVPKDSREATEWLRRRNSDTRRRAWGWA